MLKNKKRKLSGLRFFMLVVKLIPNLIYRSNKTREVYKPSHVQLPPLTNLKFGEQQVAEAAERADIQRGTKA